MNWDGEVVNEEKALRPEQEARLLRHNELLRDLTNLEQLVEIKKAILRGDNEGARYLWDEYTQAEQMGIWIAPKYGGLLTTAERKALRESPQQEEK